MGKMSRKALLKAGAGGTVAAGLAMAGADVAEAASGGAEVIQIHGTVSGAGGTVEISIEVAGTRESLSGAGWDHSPGTASDACYFTQAGSRQGKTVTVTGIVLFSPVAAFLEAAVTTVADLDSGAITWTFDPVGALGPFVFTGTGTVVRR